MKSKMQSCKTDGVSFVNGGVLVWLYRYPLKKDTVFGADHTGATAVGWIRMGNFGPYRPFMLALSNYLLSVSKRHKRVCVSGCAWNTKPVYFANTLGGNQIGNTWHLRRAKVYGILGWLEGVLCIVDLFLFICLTKNRINKIMPPDGDIFYFQDRICFYTEGSFYLSTQGDLETNATFFGENHSKAHLSASGSNLKVIGRLGLYHYEWSGIICKASLSKRGSAVSLKYKKLYVC